MSRSNDLCYVMVEKFISGWLGIGSRQISRCAILPVPILCMDFIAKNFSILATVRNKKIVDS
jgi:hypothetical protein